MKKIITLFAAGFMLAATAAHAQLPNGTFETWQNYTVSSVPMETPTGWHSSDSLIGTYGIVVGGAKKQTYKTTDKHGGTYAACLVSKTYTTPVGARVLPGVITNANISVDLSTLSYISSGGTAVTQRVANASAWIKYLPKGSDTATFGVAAVIRGAGAGGADSVVGSGVAKINSTSAFTLFTVPVTYINATVVPTHIQIGFIAGSATAAVDSSVMVVDDAQMTMASGVTRLLFNADVMQVYPNPATGTLNLKGKESTPLTWEAIGANGQVLAHKEFTGTASVSLTSFAAGTYFFRVLNDKKELVQTGKFLVK